MKILKEYDNKYATALTRREKAELARLHAMRIPEYVKRGTGAKIKKRMETLERKAMRQYERKHPESNIAYVKKQQELKEQYLTDVQKFITRPNAAGLKDRFKTRQDKINYIEKSAEYANEIIPTTKKVLRQDADEYISSLYPSIAKFNAAAGAEPGYATEFKNIDNVKNLTDAELDNLLYSFSNIKNIDIQRQKEMQQKSIETFNKRHRIQLTKRQWTQWGKFFSLNEANKSFIFENALVYREEFIDRIEDGTDNLTETLNVFTRRPDLAKKFSHALNTEAASVALIQYNMHSTNLKDQEDEIEEFLNNIIY